MSLPSRNNEDNDENKPVKGKSSAAGHSRNSGASSARHTHRSKPSSTTHGATGARDDNKMPTKPIPVPKKHSQQRKHVNKPQQKPDKNKRTIYADGKAVTIETEKQDENDKKNHRKPNVRKMTVNAGNPFVDSEAPVMHHKDGKNPHMSRPDYDKPDAVYSDDENVGNTDHSHLYNGNQVYLYNEGDKKYYHKTPVERDEDGKPVYDKDSDSFKHRDRTDEEMEDGRDYSQKKHISDKLQQGVNNGFNHAANKIANKMSMNNGNILSEKPNLSGSKLIDGVNIGARKMANFGWRHGGANALAKGMNGLNKGINQVINGGRQLALKVKNTVHAIWVAATNPATLIIAAILVVILVILTIFNTYGNGGIFCPTKGGGSGYASKIVSWAEKIAADDSHGYSQPNRKGNPDYDCSSLVYFAVTEGAGIQLSIDYPFATGSNIDDKDSEGGVLQAAGFQKIEWDGKDVGKLQKGDIVWKDGHTEIYSGDGKFTGAHHDENGGIDGPKAGDQTGDEISTSTNVPSGMSYILRPPSGGGDDSSSDGSSGGASGGDADFKQENAKQVFEYLTKEMGFSGPGAAGALAVANRESRFDPKAKNPGGGVAGIFQWSGYSNQKNGNRIVAEGSIKAGDDSTLTMENELKLLGFELNGSYHKAKTTVGAATDPVQAAKDWSVLYEGVALSDGQSNIAQITEWAKMACDAYDCESIEAQPDKLAEGGNGTDSTNPPTTANASKSVQCMMNKNETGSTGDFKQGKGGYEWMCNDDRIKVCKAGDTGPVPAPYGYQCVWYAWTRLYMIHGINETYQGNGGQIGENATKNGWTNPDKPAPGDGLSYYGLLGSSDRPTGHVMVVEKVEDDPSGWKITLSEGNYGCASSGCWEGYNGGRTLTKAQLEAAGGVQGSNYWFFHNPKWDNQS